LQGKLAVLSTKIHTKSHYRIESAPPGSKFSIQRILFNVRPTLAPIKIQPIEHINLHGPKDSRPNHGIQHIELKASTDFFLTRDQRSQSHLEMIFEFFQMGKMFKPFKGP